MNALAARVNTLPVRDIVALAKEIGVSLGDYARKTKPHLANTLAKYGNAERLSAALDARHVPAVVDVDATDTREVPVEFTDDVETTPVTAPVAPVEAATDLQRALRALVGNSVDANMVRAIVAEEMAKTPRQVATIVVRDKVETTMPDGEYFRPEMQQVVDLATQGMNVMLVGPAGSGKSHLGKQVATVLQRPFSANSCSAGMSESALSGWLLPIGDAGKFSFVPASFVSAYESGGVHLIDEIDASDPNTLVFINQALANGHFFLPQRHERPEVVRHPQFVCIAAANTYGTGGDRIYVGREQLDAATLDRFWMIEIGYDATLEERTCEPVVLEWGTALRKRVNEMKLRRVVSTRKLQQASIMLRSGWKMPAIKAAFFAPWSADERAKVGA